MRRLLARYEQAPHALATVPVQPDAHRVLRAPVITQSSLIRTLRGRVFSQPSSELKGYMHHLTYLSQATRPLSAKALTCLLDQARQANKRQHLTGALVYGSQRFIQLLEGEQAPLEQSYARISRDPRHQHLCRVADYPIVARQFADWPLAFQALSPAQFAHLASYLTPTQVKQRLSGYGSVATSFVEAMRALVQPPTAYEKQSAHNP